VFRPYINKRENKDLKGSMYILFHWSPSLNKPKKYSFYAVKITKIDISLVVTKNNEESLLSSSRTVTLQNIYE